MDHDLIFGGLDNIHVVKGTEDRIDISFTSLGGQQLVILLLGICCCGFMQPCKGQRQATFHTDVLEWRLPVFTVSNLVLAPWYVTSKAENISKSVISRKNPDKTTHIRCSRYP